ncbi:hypothetical protein LTS08_008175 [Lithohypha guttulata]|nr:hypothetical protein LTS08_008175 [Lithohypha guttulata]
MKSTSLISTLLALFTTAFAIPLPKDIHHHNATSVIATAPGSIKCQYNNKLASVTFLRAHGFKLETIGHTVCPSKEWLIASIVFEWLLVIALIGAGLFGLMRYIQRLQSAGDAEAPEIDLRTSKSSRHRKSQHHQAQAPYVQIKAPTVSTTEYVIDNEFEKVVEDRTLGELESDVELTYLLR